MTLYMAPMQGVTNYIYRDIYFRYFKGYDVAVSPLIVACNAVDIKKRVFNDVRPELNTSNIELIPQLLSNSSRDFIQLSKILFGLGYKKVNWNLGCPFPMVRNKKRGSGLLSFPDLIVTFLEEVIPAIPNKLSLKVRLGIEDSAPLYALLPRLNDFSLENIIIHPRVAVQLYGGQVDLAAFEKALALTKHEVVYSGDIYTLKDFKDFSKRFPRINKWMLGRGGVRDPFLAERIKNIDSGDLGVERKRFKEFYEAIFEKYQETLCGPGHLLHKMKELWSYWALNFENSQGILKRILKAKTLLKYEEVAKDIFDSCGAGAFHNFNGKEKS